MKIKFEIEAPESLFDKLWDSMYKPNEPFELSEVLRGHRAVCQSASMSKKPVYGIGTRPIAHEPSDGEINLIIVP